MIQVHDLYKYHKDITYDNCLGHHDKDISLAIPLFENDEIFKKIIKEVEAVAEEDVTTAKTRTTQTKTTVTTELSIFEDVPKEGITNIPNIFKNLPTLSSNRRGFLPTLSTNRRDPPEKKLTTTPDALEEYDTEVDDAANSSATEPVLSSLNIKYKTIERKTSGSDQKLGQKKPHENNTITPINTITATQDTSTSEHTDTETPQENHSVQGLTPIIHTTIATTIPSTSPKISVNSSSTKSTTIIHTPITTTSISIPTKTTTSKFIASKTTIATSSSIKTTTSTVTKVISTTTTTMSTTTTTTVKTTKTTTVKTITTSTVKTTSTIAVTTTTATNTLITTTSTSSSTSNSVELKKGKSNVISDKLVSAVQTVMNGINNEDEFDSSKINEELKSIIKSGILDLGVLGLWARDEDELSSSNVSVSPR